MKEEHRVDIGRCRGRASASYAGETVADSDRALAVRETGHPPVVYFPVADVAMRRLRATDRRTRCPWKGEASYWTVAAGGGEAANAAWGYPDPIPAAAALKGHIAFYGDRIDVRGGDGGPA